MLSAKSEIVPVGAMEVTSALRMPSPDPPCARQLAHPGEARRALPVPATTVTADSRARARAQMQ